MTKEYNHLEIEPKWQAYWEEKKTFKSPEKPGEKKLYVLDMFPYPSGSGLHIGHPLGYTGSDIYARFKRMQGFSVLHPMGYDAFGLPAEQHAINTGEHPGEITKQNCQRFTKQLKSLGFSYDWDRGIATCDADYYHWTQWIFLKLYNSWFDTSLQKARPISELEIPEEIKAKGEKEILNYQANFRLAYYGEAMVNWCDELGTVLANEEVIDGKSERGGFDVVRKPMKQWLLRITAYADRLIDELDEIDWPENIKEQQRNWVGRRQGTEIDFITEDGEDIISAFTTRPDTLFGVTFFVISPEHPLVDKLSSQKQKRAVNEYKEKASKLSELDRTMENRDKTGVFTGSYVVNPINQEKVPVYVGDYVLVNYGTGAVMGVPAHDERDFKFAKKYEIPIRATLVPKNKEDKVLNDIMCGNLCWTEPGIMIKQTFPVSDELKLTGKSNEEGKKIITKWLEENNSGKAVITYRLRDWLFSRQRYWGEPIPIVHWEDGTSTAVDEKDLPLKLPDVVDYKPSSDGESPLSKATEWLKVIHPEKQISGRRETNTMPQWAGSCWYYLRFIDPKNKEKGWEPDLEKSWMPVDFYIGGAEHAVLHLLYSRFWHKVLFDLNLVSTAEPFQKLFNQGMILSSAFKDNRGALVPVDLVKEEAGGKFIKSETGEAVEKITAKMSKSLKNVVNPDDVIKEYGTDTLRMYLMFMGPLESTKPWDSKAITGVHRFVKKSFSYISNLHFISESDESDEVKKALNRTIKKLEIDFEGVRFNTTISSLMELLNTFSTFEISKETAEKFVLLISPLAPHLAEELWSRLGHSNSLSGEPWPKYDELYLKDSTVTVVLQVKGKKRATVEVEIDISDEILKASTIESLKGTSFPVKGEDKFIIVRDKKTSNPKLVNVIPT